MSQSTPLTPEQQQAVDDAKRQFEEMKANVAKATSQAHAAVAGHLKVAQERLLHAQKELHEATFLLGQLEPHKDNPQITSHYHNISLQAKVYEHMQNMLWRTEAIQLKNLAEIAAIPPLELKEGQPDLTPMVRIPSDDVGVQEDTLRMEVAMLDYHWYRNRKGLDAIMRASGVETRGFEATPEEEAAQAAKAAELQKAAASDQTTKIMVGKLGPELEEAYALLDWARDSLLSFASLPDQAKKDVFVDPDWLKLRASLHQILDLGERVKDMPALTALIPYEGPADPIFVEQPPFTGGLKL